jgi:hypothetical protein
MERELDVAQGAVAQLRNYGEASLLYVTAEFQPFSNQQMPDLLFIPSLGPKQAETFLVELRLWGAQELPSHLPMSLLEHRQFAIESLGCSSLNFAFASDKSFDAILRNLLEASGIHILEDIRDASSLAHGIASLTLIPFVDEV